MKEEIDVICGGKFVFGNHEHYKLIKDFEIRLNISSQNYIMHNVSVNPQKM